MLSEVPVLYKQATNTNVYVTSSDFGDLAGININQQKYKTNRRKKSLVPK